MINLIAAIGLNNELGYKNQLLCKLPSDLRRFKELTTGQFCVMGRKTYESIGKPLPNRHNVIVTRNTKYQAHPETYVYTSLEEVIFEYKSLNNNENELFIIGGEQVYKQALEYAERMFLTIIDHKFSQVDAYFPKFDISEWIVTENIKNKADEKNLYNHYFVTYEKRNKNK